MKTYVFPGQGSQRKGMGEGLFEEFSQLTKVADEVLGYSIKELCLDNPDQKLNQTQYTQTALYVVNALSYLSKVEDAGTAPDFVAGHSLGEYNALQVAGVFSFENGLKLVKKRGELMSQVKEGAMAAILNCPEPRIREILHDANLTTIDIANLNAPTQIVISGLKEDINQAQPYFEKADAMFIPLNTSGAFHSRYMKDAEAEFEKYLKKFKFSKPKIRVISNVTARPHESNEVARNLVLQLTNCVRWSDSIMYLLDQGEMEIEELGVGDVLTKLTTYIRKAWTPGAIVEGQPVKDTVKEEAVAQQAVAQQAVAQQAVEEFVPGKDLSAQELVERWNNACPIGTRALSPLYDTELETRTEAIVLFGHRAAVYMKGYNGYFDLREVTPVSAA